MRMPSPLFLQLREIRNRIHVVNALQSRNADGGDVADFEIGVETIFKSETVLARVVGDNQFARESPSPTVDNIIRRERGQWSRPPGIPAGESAD